MDIFANQVAEDASEIFMSGERKKASAIGEHTNKPG